MNHFLQPEIFLTYANTQIKDNPQGLSALLLAMKKNNSWKNFAEDIDVVPYIDALIEADKIPYTDKWREEIENECSSNDYWASRSWGDMKADFEQFDRLFSSFLSGEKLKLSDSPMHLHQRNKDIRLRAFENVYAAKLNGCNSDPLVGCFWRGYRQEIFEKWRLKCYECDHKHFVYILTELSQGKEYSKIEGLHQLILTYRHSHNQISFNIFPSQKAPFQETIKKVSFDLSSTKISTERGFGFPAIFLNSVTDSLINFLIL